MAAEGFKVDLNKPLVFQVGHLGDAYQEWVDHPIPSNESHRFFANDILESLSRANSWAIALGWIPVACWFISKAAKAMLSLSEVASMVVLGIFVWTAVEYIVHRFFFHMHTKSYWGNTLNFIVNGYHHKNPMDSSRLITPSFTVALMCFPTYGLVRLFSTPATAPAVFGGWLLKSLKKYHTKHHFGDSGMGFGVTSPFWDIVFGTVPILKVAGKVGH